MKPTQLLPFALLAGAAFAGEPAKKAIAPPEEEDRWKFSLSIPGWIVGATGDVGLHGHTGHIDVNPSDLLRHADMITHGAQATVGIEFNRWIQTNSTAPCI